MPRLLSLTLLGSLHLFACAADEIHGDAAVAQLQQFLAEYNLSGVEVIAVDRYPNAPGHQVAHRSHTIDMTDPAALRALVELERPHLIVPEIEAIATDALAAIETDGLAEVIPTARATPGQSLSST